MLSQEQINNRRNGLGATDCAAVLGLSPYKTPYQLWLEKTGRADDQPILDEKRLRIRHAHEQTIADEYEAEVGVKLKKVEETIYHNRLPFMLCHLDRVVDGKNKIIECKSSSGFMRQNWGQSGSDEAPLHYILQVQHQLACTGYDEADLAALIDIDDYRIYPINRNQNIINKIESECERFWNDNVLADNPPDPTTRGDLKIMYPLNNGNFIDATSEVLNLIKELNFVKRELKNMEIKKSIIETEIIKFIGPNDGIKEDDQVIVKFLANKNGSKILRIKGE